CTLFSCCTAFNVSIVRIAHLQPSEVAAKRGGIRPCLFLLMVSTCIGYYFAHPKGAGYEQVEFRFGVLFRCGRICQFGDSGGGAVPSIRSSDRRNAGESRSGRLVASQSNVRRTSFQSAQPN